MGMDIHAAGHDDHAGGVQRGRTRREGRDDAPGLDANVPNLAVDPVRGIMHGAAHDPKPPDASHQAFRPSAMASATARTAAAAAAGPFRIRGRGSGTSSIRYAMPAS